ncbi:DUF4065 domain-containing protein [Grimontia kaedaensis]|uniref:DUF4065 domain-containing protein n=1 Tax=Grimontia kaedaensis TaxID=2872157 RepID=A0ABY4WRE3_9GAMM|nr:type II toxin-antitoxin system antitoxin SocA domain-containing protein [Grimontia kaedaensis]USH02118.1 DUF4065 domain-containing protein [Grimontia kaedaensis]
MANIQDVAKMFVSLGEEDGVSNLKLQKLAYYAQGFFLALYGKTLFDDDIEAWAHGPVIPTLYHEYKSFGKSPIELESRFNAYVCLTKQEIAHIEEIYDVFGQFSAWKLRNMTHEEAPWVANEAVASVISKKELKEYFETRVS